MTDWLIRVVGLVLLGIGLYLFVIEQLRGRKGAEADVSAWAIKISGPPGLVLTGVGVIVFLAPNLISLFDASGGDNGSVIAYERELRDARGEVEDLLVEVNDINKEWDDKESELFEAGHAEDRQTLYLQTESALEGIAAQTQRLQAGIRNMTAPSGAARAQRSVEDAAARLHEAAIGMLEGLRLPRADEEVPGTARRRSLDDFREAADDFDSAVGDALEAAG